MEEIVAAKLVQLKADPSLVKSINFLGRCSGYESLAVHHEVQATPVPERFIMLHFKLCSGAIDLVAHIEFFHWIRALYQQDNALIRQVFLLAWMKD